MRLMALKLGLMAMIAAASAPSVPPLALSDLEVTVLPARSTWSIREPIVVGYQFKNVSAKPTSFTLARSPFGTLFFMVLTITLPSGSHIIRELPDEADEMFSPGDISLSPGESVILNQVLNEWYDFHEVGEYRVTATIPITPSGKQGFFSRSDPAATVTFSIKVGPRNAEEIKETCDTLASKAHWRNGLEAVHASHALRFATDPLCIPALVITLGQLDSMIRTEALLGLARVGTPDAAAAVAASWEHLDASDRTYALQFFTSAGAGEMLRAALVKIKVHP
ncbi:MAG TPA: hypothetical protein VKY89_00885 [Thermoanaerobaculia bacterium]|jgi:hypothetical protein|nr:hypothetical protein [Thermoanaerobaculia bacterium]